MNDQTLLSCTHYKGDFRYDSKTLFAHYIL